ALGGLDGSYLALEHARHCLMQPRIDLEVAVLFRSEAQFYATIGTNKRVLTKARAVLHGKVQEPFVYRTPTNLATLFAHYTQTQGRSTVIPLMEAGGRVRQVPPGQLQPLQKLRLTYYPNLRNAAASGTAGGFHLGWIGWVLLGLKNEIFPFHG
ncbi:MAG: hypothetical protein ACREPS_09510, partial [Rhodanobacteraceae bacterium]